MSREIVMKHLKAEVSDLINRVDFFKDKLGGFCERHQTLEREYYMLKADRDLKDRQLREAADERFVLEARIKELELQVLESDRQNST